MLIIKTTKYFDKKAKKLLSKNILLNQKTKEVVKKLSVNPLNPSLKSHKINSKLSQDVFSSSVTGDIRIIWRYLDENIKSKTIETLEIQILELLDIEGYSGGKSVY